MKQKAQKVIIRGNFSQVLLDISFKIIMILAVIYLKGNAIREIYVI